MVAEFAFQKRAFVVFSAVVSIVISFLVSGLQQEVLCCHYGNVREEADGTEGSHGNRTRTC